MKSLRFSVDKYEKIQSKIFRDIIDSSWLTASKNWLQVGINFSIFLVGTVINYFFSPEAGSQD